MTVFVCLVISTLEMLGHKNKRASQRKRGITVPRIRTLYARELVLDGGKKRRAIAYHDSGWDDSPRLDFFFAGAMLKCEDIFQAWRQRKEKVLVVRDVRIIREATSFRQDGPGKKSTWSFSVPMSRHLPILLFLFFSFLWQRITNPQSLEHASKTCFDRIADWGLSGLCWSFHWYPDNPVSSHIFIDDRSMAI